MFDKNRMHFMNAYYKEMEKPFGYLLVDNKPDTTAQEHVLADLFGECYVYHFSVNSTGDVNPTRVETKPAGKHSTTPVTNATSSWKLQTVTWSDVPNDVWRKYTMGAQKVRKNPEGYVIIEIYTTFRNAVNPNRPGVVMNGERYWPVKIKHWVYRLSQMSESARRRAYGPNLCQRNCGNVVAAVKERKFLLKRLLKDQGRFPEQ